MLSSMGHWDTEGEEKRGRKDDSRFQFCRKGGMVGPFQGRNLWEGTR